MHGAGLINAFFMRPGSSMVEIFPCRFPADWASHYFWRPALVEGQIVPFQIRMQDESRCRPSELEREPGGDAADLSRYKSISGCAHVVSDSPPCFQSGCIRFGGTQWFLNFLWNVDCCAGVNYHEGAEFVRASLARDQDVVVDIKALQQVLVCTQLCSPCLRVLLKVLTLCQGTTRLAYCTV